MTFSRCQRPSRKVKLSDASSTSSLNRIDVNDKFIKNYKPSLQTIKEDDDIDIINGLDDMYIDIDDMILMI